MGGHKGPVFDVGTNFSMKSFSLELSIDAVGSSKIKVLLPLSIALAIPRPCRCTPGI